MRSLWFVLFKHCSSQQDAYSGLAQVALGVPEPWSRQQNEFL
ncbi:MAG TPA: hypothetical protein V6D14_33055 [Coleofasciculaceae cyanobacterium]|jgi:hypothetical protein